MWSSSMRCEKNGLRASKTNPSSLCLFLLARDAYRLPQIPDFDSTWDGHSGVPHYPKPFAPTPCLDGRRQGCLRLPDPICSSPRAQIQRPGEMPKAARNAGVAGQRRGQSRGLGSLGSRLLAVVRD